jgi:hypothetical protein
MSVVIQAREEAALRGSSESLASASHPQTSKAGLRRKKVSSSNRQEKGKTHEIFGLPPFARPFFRGFSGDGREFLSSKCPQLRHNIFDDFSAVDRLIDV